MHKNEISKLIGKVEQTGFVLVPLDLHLHTQHSSMALDEQQQEAARASVTPKTAQDQDREKRQIMRNNAASTSHNSSYGP